MIEPDLNTKENGTLEANIKVDNYKNLNISDKTLGYTRKISHGASHVP